MTTEETIRKIKGEFRRGMNGIVSTSMREKGVDYKINFGLTLPILKEISQHYQKDAEVAEKLWHEEIRESKLLAPMLYPADKMDMETAKRWITEMPNTEVADICNMYLICKLPYAKELAYQYAKSEKELDIYISLSLFNRLAMGGNIDDTEKNALREIAKKNTANDSPTVVMAAMRLTDRLQ